MTDLIARLLAHAELHEALTDPEQQQWAADLREAAAALAAQPSQRLPLAQATAPREIWLQISDEANDIGEPFPDDHEGITWCQDSVLSCEVKYVRADLAAKDAP